MSSTSAVLTAPWPNAARAIVLAGAIAGALDITAACAYWFLMRGFPPTRILRGVASGLLGPSARTQGGLGIAALGLLLHFTIAFGAATVFYALSRKIPFLIERPILGGPLYGIAVYCFMNVIVLPLSAIHANPMAGFAPAAMAWGIPVHMLCVGLPIALAIRFATT